MRLVRLSIIVSILVLLAFTGAARAETWNLTKIVDTSSFNEQMFFGNPAISADGSKVIFTGYASSVYPSLIF